MKRCFALVALLASFILPAPIARADDDASWQSLPTETLFAVRVRDGQGFVHKLKERTKFGKVMLAPQRWENLTNTMREQDPDEWAEMEADLAKFNLKPADFGQVFAGDSGFSVVAQPQEGANPYMFFLAWLNPGGDLAERMVAALGRIPEESAEDAYPVKRTDLDLGGAGVMHLVFPEVRTQFNMDDDAAEPKPRLVDQTHLFVHRAGGRLVFGIAPPQAEKAIAAQLDAGEEVDFEQATRTDDAMALYARFLTAHANGDGGFAQKLAATPGMNQSVAPGDSVFEVTVDFAGLMNLFKSSPDTAMVAPFLEAYGLNSLGMFDLNWAIDGNILRGATFLEAKAPRPGLVGLLDQKPLPAEVPAWVPADVVNYSHFSVDLGQVYTVIKQITIETFGPMAQQNFDQAEQGTMQMLQATPDKILSSLGHRHMIAQYTPVAVEMPDDGMGEPVSMPMNRTAMVWQITDEALWQRVMGAMGMFAQMAEGKMQFAEEQGFSGWRLNHEMLSGGLFLGKGHLVLGIGKDVVSGILAAISNPPAGDAALANHPAVAQANEVGNLQPGIMYQVSDSNRYMVHFVPIMMDMLTQLAAREGDEGAAAAMAQIKQALPDKEEMDGMFGVAGGQVRMSGEGMAGDSFFVLPTAE